MHAVFEDDRTMRFSVVHKLYPGMHIEPTKGNKQQAEDYVNKRGKWEEKGEKILAKVQYGEIKGAQGQRRDVEIIGEMIEQGKTPQEILDASFKNYRYEPMIRKAYFSKRDAETPIQREVKVYYHVGESGSGKSYTAVRLMEEYGESNVFVMTDYDNGGFDGYNGQPILVLDEFRGQMKFSVLMHILDRYKSTFHARYSNIRGLWNQVHICTVYPVELLYKNMVEQNKQYDGIKQLLRRISFFVYHFVDEDAKYCWFEMVASDYSDYEALKNIVESPKSIDDEQLELPF